MWCGWMTSLICLSRALSDARRRVIVDERTTEPAIGVARYQADYSRENLVMLLVPQSAGAALPGGCFVLRFACYFALVLSFTLFTSRGVFLRFFFFRSFFSSVC